MNAKHLRSSALGSAVAAGLVMFASPSHDALSQPIKPVPPVTLPGVVPTPLPQTTTVTRDMGRRFGINANIPTIDWDFETDLQGWTGDFGRYCGPVSVQRANKTALVPLGGDYWQNSYPVGQSGRCRIDSAGRHGQMVSPEITIGAADQWLAFRVGGGGGTAAVALEVKSTTTGQGYTLNDPAGCKIPKVTDPPTPPPGTRYCNMTTKTIVSWNVAPGLVEHGTGQIGMSRVVWSLAGLAGQVVHVSVYDGNAPMGILVDDFQSSQAQPQPQPPAVWGMADLHAHLFNHLGFGGRLIAGSPHSAIGRDGQSNGTPSNMAVALGPQACHDVHGTAPNVPGIGTPISTNDGTVTLLPESGHDAAGYPNFRGWPNYKTTVHQQAYVDWIKRAWQGGLRLVQVDVGNHGPLGKLIETVTASMPVIKFTSPLAATPRDDAAAIDLQLAAIHSFATLPDVSPWAEIAKTPADARRIIGQGKLAMVLGIEVEDLGDLSAMAAGMTQAQLQASIENFGATAPMQTQTVNAIIGQTECYLRSLYARDVRHIIPIHTSDNVFGASAVYDMRMSAANRLMTGHWFPERNAFADGIRARPDTDIPTGNLPDFADKLARIFFGGQYATILAERQAWLDTFAQAQPQAPQVPQKGFAHKLGLTDVGRAAVQAMMSLGMVVDMDHMSDLAINDTIQIAQGYDYPVIFSHTGFRDLSFGRWKKSADPANSTALPRYDTPNTDTSWAKGDAANNTLLGTDNSELLANERSHSEAQVMAVAALGGMVGVGTGAGIVAVTYPQNGARTPNHCDGSSTVFAQAFSYALEKMGAHGLAIGTDINGLNGMAGPRFGPNACASAFADGVRGKFTNREVQNQSHPVKYSGPWLSFAEPRFTGPSVGTLEGLMGAKEQTRPYTGDEETVWQAVALFKAGQDHARPGKNYAGTRENTAHRMAWGFYEASISAMRPSGCDALGARNCDPANPFDTFADARAAYDVFKGSVMTDFDDHGAFEEITRRIWNKWKDMESGTNAALQKSVVGIAGAGADWDINIDGFAHYGLMPDFIQDTKNNGLTDEDLSPLFNGAEDYIEMWEKIERRKPSIPMPAAAGAPCRQS